MVKKIVDWRLSIVGLMLLAVGLIAGEREHIVFIYTSNAKQVNVMSADVASIPLFRVGDRDSTVVAYAGVLWTCQVPAKDKAVFDQRIKAKQVYVKYSEPMASDEIDHWLNMQGYARVVPKEDKEIGK
jgi:hypothetical protein